MMKDKTLIFFFTTARTAIEAKRESCSKNVNIKAEAKVSFDGSNVDEIEPLTPEDEEELTVDSSSPKHECLSK